MDIDDFNYEMQCWIEAKPETLSRLKKFYESMVSIHLGGKGLMRMFNEGNTFEERRKIFRDYTINYPKKEGSKENVRV